MVNKDEYKCMRFVLLKIATETFSPLTAHSRGGVSYLCYTLFASLKVYEKVHVRFRAIYSRNLQNKLRD